MFAVLTSPVRGMARHQPPIAVPPTLFPHADPALQREWLGEKAVIVSSGDPSSAQEPRLALCRATGLVAVIWGRVHNRSALVGELGLAVDAPSVEVVLAAFRQWGADCAGRLSGEFAYAVHDPRDGSLFAMRDALGVRPLYYAMADGELALATSIPALEVLSGRRHAVDPQWLARNMAGVSMSREATPFTGIAKLAPGHLLRLDPAGELHLRRWHRFDPASPAADRRDPAILAAYRAMLEEAVRCRLEGADGIGVETSGGLDSSTVAGFAPQMVEHADERLHGFGFIGSEKEPDAVLGVSRHAGLTNNHLFTRVSADASFERRGIGVLGHPAEHANSVAHIPFYTLAQRLGVRSLLSGFGGDEGVTNYAINHRRDLLGTGQHRALWQLLLGNPATRALRMAKAMWRHRQADYPEFMPAMLAGARQKQALLPLKGEVAEAIDLAASLEAGARWVHQYETLNQFAIGMLEQPFVSTRTESCSLVAASYGIEYHWPLLDDRLIALWLAAPTIEKVDRHMGRWLHRQAVAGVVPDSVRLQVGKYMGPSLAGPQLDMAAGVALPQDLHPALGDIIDAGKLAALRAQVASGSGAQAGNPAAMTPRRMLRAAVEVDTWLRLRDGA